MNKKQILAGAICLFTAAAGILAAVSIGAKMIPLKTVIDSFFHYQEVLDMQLVRDVRMPRALCSFMVGGLLGLSGAMMQGITRNPVAEPSILGMTQGAALTVAIASVSPALYGFWGNSIAAFAGALLSGLLVLLFSMQTAGSMHMSKLLLAGTAMSTFFISLATIIGILGNRTQELAFWVAGGLRTASWKYVLPLYVVGIICIVLAISLSHKINIVSLGDDAATGLGISPGRIRIYTIMLLIPICSICVATAGNIAFVGLIVPHILRKIIGNDYRYLLPLSFLAGSMLLVWADILARMVNQPYETPIGLFTAVIGVPVFILLVRKEKG